MVSFMVTLFIMILLTLIVLAFATISRREQRQALDDQLSTQAFYAAETGINDAKKALASNSSLNKTSCDVSAFPAGGVIDSTAKVSYTCLLIDPSPNSLEFSDIADSTGKAFPVSSGNGANIANIVLSWQNSSTTSNSNNDITCPTSPNLPLISSWSCDMPIIRVDIVPLGSLTRANLIANTMTAFLYPKSTATATSLAFSAGSSNSGVISTARCQASGTPRLCSTTITGLSQAKYYIRIRPIYADAAVSLSANEGTNTLELIGTQALVDSTGKAQDILRRIQVRVSSLPGSLTVPDFAIQSNNSICKRFQIFAGVPAVTDQSDAACDPTTP